MAVPQRKTSKAKKRSRRANHDKTKLPQISICDNCGADVLSHRVCQSCGWYKDRVAVEVYVDDEFEVEDEDLD